MLGSLRWKIKYWFTRPRSVNIDGAVINLPILEQYRDDNDKLWVRLNGFWTPKNLFLRYFRDPLKTEWCRVYRSYLPPQGKLSETEYCFGRWRIKYLVGVKMWRATHPFSSRVILGKSPRIIAQSLLYSKPGLLNRIVHSMRDRQASLWLSEYLSMGDLEDVLKLREKEPSNPGYFRKLMKSIRSRETQAVKIFHENIESAPSVNRFDNHSLPMAENVGYIPHDTKGQIDWSKMTDEEIKAHPCNGLGSGAPAELALRSYRRRDAEKGGPDAAA